MKVARLLFCGEVNPHFLVLMFMILNWIFFVWVKIGPLLFHGLVRIACSDWLTVRLTGSLTDWLTGWSKLTIHAEREREEKRRTNGSKKDVEWGKEGNLDTVSLYNYRHSSIVAVPREKCVMREKGLGKFRLGPRGGMKMVNAWRAAGITYYIIKSEEKHLPLFLVAVARIFGYWIFLWTPFNNKKNAEQKKLILS